MHYQTFIVTTARPLNEADALALQARLKAVTEVRTVKPIPRHPLVRLLLLKPREGVSDDASVTS